MTDTVFQPYSESDALRFDRSAGDRLRHRQKVRQAIRDNIIPIRGIREYQFIFGEDNPGVGSGDGNTQTGQVIEELSGQGKQPGGAGNKPGVDYYETEITLEDLIDIMFERKNLREIHVAAARKRKGFRKVGVHVHLDKKRTATSRIRRKLAIRRAAKGEADDERFPFYQDDLSYRRLVRDVRLQSNAVVMCIMDTSGSMDTMKKYLARSFFFLLYQFVRTRYNNVEVVFIAHHTQAKEVTEAEFFTKGESGGTLISSGYNKALAVINERYHPSLWNIYAFHCSDGDNWRSDSEAALQAADQLCEVCKLFGYGEIKPLDSGNYGDSLLKLFGHISRPNFHALRIENKQDIWSSFKAFLSRERSRKGADTA
jgi:sporulation protein YhbH